MVPCALVALGYGALAWPSPFNANDTVVDPSEQLPAPLRRTASPESWACRLTAGQPLVVGRLAGAHAPFVGHVNVALCDPVLPLKENCHVWLVGPAAWAAPAIRTEADRQNNRSSRQIPLLHPHKRSFRVLPTDHQSHWSHRIVRASECTRRGASSVRSDDETSCGRWSILGWLRSLAMSGGRGCLDEPEGRRGFDLTFGVPFCRHPSRGLVRHELRSWGAGRTSSSLGSLMATIGHSTHVDGAALPGRPPPAAVLRDDHRES